MQFYSYRFIVRETSLNHLHYYKTLFSQFAVDMMAKMISERLHFIRNQIRSSGKDALAVASSGIAATLLSGGITAHSTFKLPLNILGI